MRKDLTTRQRQVLEAIKEFIREKGYPPTVREIGKRFGFASSSSHDFLKVLERKGYIKRSKKRSRSLELTEFAPSAALPPGVVEIPVLGRVAAGDPLLAVENVEDTVAIEERSLGRWFGRRRRGSRKVSHFFLRVEGDSMFPSGIHSGDYVLVKPQASAQPGQIVVAMIEDEAAVKKFYLEKKYIRLESSNRKYKPIRVARDFRLIGVVVGLLRRYPSAG